MYGLTPSNQFFRLVHPQKDRRCPARRATQQNPNDDDIIVRGYPPLLQRPHGSRWRTAGEIHLGPNSNIVRQKERHSFPNMDTIEEVFVIAKFTCCQFLHERGLYVAIAPPPPPGMEEVRSLPSVLFVVAIANKSPVQPRERKKRPMGKQQGSFSPICCSSAALPPKNAFAGANWSPPLLSARTRIGLSYP